MPLHPPGSSSVTAAAQGRRAFSITEVAIALGLIAFALMTLLALLPMGINSNANSAEETRAVCLLSALKADLSNTHPLANGGKSRIYGFQLPYAVDAEGRTILNPALSGPTTALGAGNTSGIDEANQPTAPTVKTRFQASVIYTYVPAAGTPGGIQARLVVNWPAQPGASVADLTEPRKSRGFVEAIVSFPAP